MRKGTGIFVLLTTTLATAVLPNTSAAASTAAEPPPQAAQEQRKMADFDGDGKADLAVWRPSDGTWHIQKSNGTGTIDTQYGQTGDIPVAADYDGDHKADLALFRPPTATWYVRKSTGRETIRQFGNSTDRPVPADYDGDGLADLAVRSTGFVWSILRSRDNQTTTTQFGAQYDLAVPADYDGDAITDLAYWHYDDCTWHIQRSSDHQVAVETVQGCSAFDPWDVAVGDLDGDHKSDFTAIGGNYLDGREFVIWTYRLSGGGTSRLSRIAGRAPVTFTPLTGDFDGNGRDDLALYYSDFSDWSINLMPSGQLSGRWGLVGDIPV